MREIISNSPDETFRFGIEFASELSPGDVVGLAGELGSGKTLFTGGVCLGLGYRGNVTSPSFVRIHAYPHEPPLYHADFYLLRSEEEVVDLGLDELYGGDCIVIVEWAQRFPNLLPAICWWIEFDWVGDSETVRRVVVDRRNC